MAKKKSEPVDQPEYEDVEPIVVDIPHYTFGVDSGLPDADFTVVTELTPRPDEPRYRVTFALPRGVLVALLDPSHAMADNEGAVRLGLLGAGGALSPMGKLVRGGFDETAVRHKMLAAWREAHNREVDGK